MMNITKSKQRVAPTPVVRASGRAGGEGKAACRRVRSMKEAMTAKEVVQLPNGWKITPPGINDGFLSISVGRPIPDSIFD